jgi:hypothetical protein
VKYFLLILVLLVLAGCFDKGDCLKTNTDKVRIVFRSKTDGKNLSLRLNSVTAQGFPTALLSNQDVAGTFELRIDPNQAFTNFIFDYKLGNVSDKDTLKLTYRPLARVPASDCGAFLYFTDLNYAKTGFDSIRIVNPQLLPDANILNVQIFR